MGITLAAATANKRAVIKAAMTAQDWSGRIIRIERCEIVIQAKLKDEVCSP
jgi:hypothetical protein